MSHTPNELHDMFPDKKDKLHELKVSSGEFVSISEQYHEVNREIHRGETDVEPMDDFHLEELRKKRLQLLDRVKNMLD